MSKQILIIVLVMLTVALVGGAAFWKGSTDADESVAPAAKTVQLAETAADDAAVVSETAADPAPAAKPTVKNVSITIYEDAASGEELEAAMADDESTLTLSGIGFDRLVLVSIASVSGSKYEHAEQKIVFWEKDGQAAVYRGDKKIFESLSDESDLAAAALSVYEDADGTEIEVEYAEDSKTALLSGLDFDELPLKSVVSASGAKYEHTGEKIVLWSQGDDVTVYRADKKIFAGSIQ